MSKNRRQDTGHRDLG